MNIKKIFSKRKMGIGVLVGLYLFTWGPNIFADEEDDGGEIDPRKNIIAIHDSNSSQYNKDCLDCHADILSAQSLDPSISNVHVAMFDFAAGKPGDDKQCIWCHRTVDLAQGTQSTEKSRGNLRRQVDVTLCTLCHGSPPRTVENNKEPELSALAKQFYQADLALDGPALYDLACAACHRDLANSKVQGESASEIQEKINKNKGGMGPLSVFTTQEIQAIADALAKADEDDD
jgi:cytochrome c553